MRVLLLRLSQALDLTNALADGLSADALGSRNGTAPSNSIGEQFWCVVGARESYAHAFDAGAWQGFACSLKDSGTPEAVRWALASSRDVMAERIRAAEAGLDDARAAILIDLLEHEAQHHGQLIRYFYANRLPFPPPFARRYALG